MNSIVNPFPEMKSLESWLGSPVRHPNQWVDRNEADCEIIETEPGHFLTSTIDTISDEISMGLYQDPYLAGYITAVASLSDLAATGSNPIGLLFSATWKSDTSNEYKSKVAKGFQDACSACGTFLLGGDTGSGLATVLSGVGLGSVRGQKPLTRLGAKPGDHLCLIGKTGVGPSLAIERLFAKTHSNNESLFENMYRPKAQIIEGQALLGIAHCAMDSSDGILSTIDTLCELNHLSVDIDFEETTLSDPALQFAKACHLPTLALWIVEHGDFQLLFSCSEENIAKAKSAVSKTNELHVIGKFRSREMGHPADSTLKIARPTGQKTALPFPLHEIRLLLTENQSKPDDAFKLISAKIAPFLT